MTDPRPLQCYCVRHTDHGDCELLCPLSWGCFPIAALPSLTDAAVQNMWDEALNRTPHRAHVMPYVQPKITGPALHGTQVRAYALIAASNMVGGTAGFHPHASDVRAWENRVLDTARKFERYINGTAATPPGSEETPK